MRDLFSFSVTGRCVKWAVETVSSLLEGVEVLTSGFGEVEFFCFTDTK